MSARAQKSVVINRPVASVFSFVLNGGNNRLWKPSVLEAHPLDQAPYAAGSRFHQQLKGPGGPIQADYRITEYEPNALLAFEVVSGPARWNGRYEFRAQGTATELSYRLDYEPGEIDRALTQPLLGDVQRVLQEQAASGRLSPPERRALLLQADGKTDRDIAGSMFVGEGTVRNYISSGLAKLVAPTIQEWMDNEVGTLDELKAFLEKIA